MKPCLALLFLAFLSCVALAQNPTTPIARLEPEQPKWGTTLTITYNPKAEGAKLAAAADIYLTGWMIFSDHSTKRMQARMNRVDGLFKYEMPVEKNLAHAAFNFVTLNDWDRKAALKTKFYREDGVAARGAHQAASGRDYAEAFNREIALYPDNFAAYRTKWMLASGYDRAKYAAMVAEDLEQLSLLGKQDAADYLCALSYGYLLLKQEPKSREIIQQMMMRFPTSPLTELAFGDYWYQAFSQQIKGEGPAEVEKLRLKFIERNPATELAREWAISFAYQQEVPPTIVEAISQKWMAEQPEHPLPYFALALAYCTHRQKLNQAAESIEKGLTFFLQGKSCLYGDLGGQEAEMYLPSAFLTSADIYLLQGSYSKALGAVKAGQALAKNTTVKSFFVEGEIWSQLGNTARAEAAYLEAANRGSKDAEGKLKIIYGAKQGSLTGFEEYLAKAKAKPAATTPAGAKKSAPAFRVTSLDGQQYDLAALRGKVVVLNFWFIGCAPCRVEMPGLNQLVDEFKGQDVVFLALALDPAAELQSFVKTTSFKYQIIPDASKLTEQFQVGSFPTHVVIDKAGNISARLTGGSDKRHEELRPLINQALNER